MNHIPVRTSVRLLVNGTLFSQKHVEKRGGSGHRWGTGQGTGQSTGQVTDLGYIFGAQVGIGGYRVRYRFGVHVWGTSLGYNGYSRARQQQVQLQKTSQQLALNAKHTGIQIIAGCLSTPT